MNKKTEKIGWFLLGVVALLVLGFTVFPAGIRLTNVTANRPLFINPSGDITNVSGTPDGTKFVRDDGVLAVPSGGSDSTQHVVEAFGDITVTNTITQTGGGVALFIAGAIKSMGLALNLADSNNVTRQTITYGGSTTFNKTNGSAALIIDKDGPIFINGPITIATNNAPDSTVLLVTNAAGTNFLLTGGTTTLGNYNNAVNHTLNAGWMGGKHMTYDSSVNTLNLYNSSAVTRYTLSGTSGNSAQAGTLSATGAVYFGSTLTNVGAVDITGQATFYGGSKHPTLTPSRALVLNSSGNPTNASGTPDGTKFLRDDNTYAVPSGGGAIALSNMVDVNFSSPVNDRDVMWFDAATGKWFNQYAFFNYNISLSTTNIFVGSNTEHSVSTKTNASFSLVFTGTPQNGEVVNLSVSNYSASSIFMTNTSTTYDSSVAANVLTFTIPALSIRTFKFISSTNLNLGVARWETLSGLVKRDATQFGDTGTIISGALFTNKVVRGQNMPALTALRALVLNSSGDITNAIGTPDGTKFLRDDGTYAVPTGGVYYYSTTTASTNFAVTVGVAIENSVDITASNSFGITYVGTPLNNEVLFFAVSNYSASSINMTNPAYDLTLASNVNTFAIQANSIRAFKFVNSTNLNLGVRRWELRETLMKQMELLPGSNITLTTNAANSAVTVSASGGAASTNWPAFAVGTGSFTNGLTYFGDPFNIINGSGGSGLSFSDGSVSIDPLNSVRLGYLTPFPEIHADYFGGGRIQLMSLPPGNSSDHVNVFGTNVEKVFSISSNSMVWVKGLTGRTNDAFQVRKTNSLPALTVDSTGQTVAWVGLTLPTGAGNAKVLTSDAAGVATWQTPSSGGSAVTNGNQFGATADGTLTLKNGLLLTNVYVEGKLVVTGDGYGLGDWYIYGQDLFMTNASSGAMQRVVYVTSSPGANSMTIGDYVNASVSVTATNGNSWLFNGINGAFVGNSSGSTNDLGTPGVPWRTNVNKYLTIKAGLGDSPAVGKVWTATTTGGDGGWSNLVTYTTSQQVLGTLTGPTNYVFVLSTNSSAVNANVFYCGSNNVNIVVSNTADNTIPIPYTIIVTNRTATPYTVGFVNAGTVTNNHLFMGTYGAAAPSVLTNGTTLFIAGLAAKTNHIIGYSYTGIFP